MSRPLTLLLASASPARLATLRTAGVEPVVVVSEVDEEAHLAAARERYGDLEPADVALLLARAKAEDVAARLEHVDTGDAPVALLLGCDSVLELGDEVHGKPVDADEARQRWRAMRGRSGTLHTGHWLLDVRDPAAGGGGGIVGATASATVHFADVDDVEIDAYVATGEPLHVAGAFTIDGRGAPFVRAIEGDPGTVVGVSLPLLRDLVRDLGASWPDLWVR